jgi:hypothetical protein
LKIVDRVQSGIPIEDSRVELKATWISPQKAARRIAGHANAARGAPILWLIGLDEKYGVVGVDHSRFLSWHHKVAACFDGIAPQVTDLIIPINGSSIVALVFDTDRAPFVVQNPVFGTQGGGPVQWEIPWREGTAIRSSGRRDLLKLLSPHQSVPVFEVLSGVLNARLDEANPQRLLWQLSLSLYNLTLSDDRIVIPFHKCRASFEIAGQSEWRVFETFLIRPPYRVGGFSSSLQAMLSLTIQGTPDEVFITGPGKLLMEAETHTLELAGLTDSAIHLAIVLLPIAADIPLQLQLNFRPVTPENGAMYTWRLNPETGD